MKQSGFVILETNSTANNYGLASEIGGAFWGQNKQRHSLNCSVGVEVCNNTSFNSLLKKVT